MGDARLSSHHSQIDYTLMRQIMVEISCNYFPFSSTTRSFPILFDLVRSSVTKGTEINTNGVYDMVVEKKGIKELS